MVDLLADNPLLLLFAVAATGYLVGKIRVAGFELGVAAVLFAGIGFGALDPRLAISDEIWNLGLVLFVYTVGLATGPGFVASLRRRGIAANGGLIAAVGLAALAALGTETLLGLSAAAAAGTYSGSLTNTPALAAVLEYLQSTGRGFGLGASEPVVGYSLTYPIGVLLPLVAVFFVMRRQPAAAPGPAGGDRIVAVTAHVDAEGLPPLRELRRGLEGVAFGRLERDGETVLAEPDVVPRPGDLVSVVGAPAQVEAVTERLGHESSRHIELERTSFDIRRILVSNRTVAGRRLDEIDLPGLFGAAITRVRRGDVDLVATPETVVELGDRVRVLAPRERLAAVGAYLGDSVRRISEVDVLTLGVGVTAGLLLGLVPIPLPGGGTFELGFAGGPLIVALVLGSLGRTGPLVWQLPYTANLTLRQLGTVLFLAGIGVRSGQAFASTAASPEALRLAAAGILITGTCVGVTLLVGLRLLHLAPATLAGIVSGTQTQPAVLAYATAQVRDDREVNLGYATVYPLAVVLKIVLAQLLVALGS